MQLPPQDGNEPEWLVVQRANKAADRQFTMAFAPMQAALAGSLVPLALLPRGLDIEVIGVLVAVYGALVTTFCIKVLRPRTTARTVGRYVVNYVGIAWSIFACFALFVSVMSLLAV